MYYNESTLNCNHTEVVAYLTNNRTNPDYSVRFYSDVEGRNIFKIYFPLIQILDISLPMIISKIMKSAWRLTLHDHTVTFQQMADWANDEEPDSWCVGCHHWILYQYKYVVNSKTQEERTIKISRWLFTAVSQVKHTVVPKNFGIN